MQLISLPYVYDFGAKLQQLRHIPFDSPLKESLWRLLDAEKALTECLNSSVYIYCVRACIAPGNTLLQAIKKLSTDDKERVLDFFDTYSITNALEKFEAVFTAEMNVSASFLVKKKRGYDTADLMLAV